MRLPLVGVLFAAALAAGCPTTQVSDDLAIYEMPVAQQKQFFLTLSSEEQIEVLLASFKRTQAWDMRLLDWLAESPKDVVSPVKRRVTIEMDDWRLETLALAVERLSAHHVCRLDSREAHGLLIVILNKIDSSPARNTVERIIKRHDIDSCRMEVMRRPRIRTES